MAETAVGTGPWRTWTESVPAVKAILVGVLVNRLGAFFQTFLVLFLTERGFSSGQAGLALGGYGAGSLLGVLIGGALADRLGPRAATLVSMCGSAVMLVTVLYVRPYPLLFVAVVLVGLISTLYRPASATLLSQLAGPERQVMTFALYRWALNIGTTAAPLLGAAMIAFSYDLLFWADAITAIAYGVIAATALPRRAPATDAAPTGERRGYTAVLSDRRYVLYLLAMLVNATVYVQYVATLPLTMHDLGYATVWYSAVIALNGLIVITCELVVTKLTQRWPVRLVVVAGFCLLGAGLSLYALPLGVGIFVVGTLVWTLAEIVGGPTMFAYPGLAAPPHLRGRYIASMQLMFNLGSAVGPAVGTAVYIAFGRSLWWCCGLMCLLGLALAVAGMRDRRPEPPDVSEHPPAGTDPATRGTDPAKAGSDPVGMDPAPLPVGAEPQSGDELTAGDPRLDGVDAPLAQNRSSAS